LLTERRKAPSRFSRGGALQPAGIGFLPVPESGSAFSINWGGTAEAMIVFRPCALRQG